MTLGHQDLMRRASTLFPRLILAVAAGHHKRTMFSIAERLEIAKELAEPYKNVEVVAFRGLLRDFVVENGGKVVVRGLRAVSDFEYEFQMAGMNRQLMPDVETLFLTPSDQYQFISGTFVREIAVLGGDVSKFVAPLVLSKLKDAHRAAARRRVAPMALMITDECINCDVCEPECPNEAISMGDGLLRHRAGQVHRVRGPLRFAAVRAGVPGRVHSGQSGACGVADQLMTKYRAPAGAGWLGAGRPGHVLPLALRRLRRAGRGPARRDPARVAASSARRSSCAVSGTHRAGRRAPARRPAGAEAGASRSRRPPRPGRQALVARRELRRLATLRVGARVGDVQRRLGDPRTGAPSRCCRSGRPVVGRQRVGHRAGRGRQDLRGGRRGRRGARGVPRGVGLGCRRTASRRTTLAADARSARAQASAPRARA